MDYDQTNFFLSDGSCGVIRFKATNANTAIVPTNLSQPAPLPFTNHGFTSGNNGRLGVPEWEMDNFAQIDEGSELWELFSNGTEVLKAKFSVSQNKFIPVP